MKLLNIFEKLYNHPNFNTILLWLIIISIVIFALILFLGLRDKNKEEREALKEEEPEDITFTEIDEKDKIKEDVTFEMPTLTKNLVDFKKNIEEEIENSDNVDIVPENNEKVEEDTKSIKVLDINEIEDTAILNQLFEEDIVAFEEESKESKLETK